MGPLARKLSGPVWAHRVRETVPYLWYGTMSKDTTRGNESPDRQAESTDNHANCPHCETPILALVTRGPSSHYLDPCGCRVTETTACDLAGDSVNRGRGVAADGGEYEVSDRDTDEMTLTELRKELAELQERVDFWKPYEEQEAAWDRRDEVWEAVRERADVDVPTCPECGGGRWGQSPGDPVECLECGAKATANLEEAVHDAWDAIAEGRVPDHRVYRDPDGRRLSVVIAGERLRFNDNRSSTEHIVFERDHRHMADLDPEDRPQVVLKTTQDPHWTAVYHSEDGDRIALGEHEERTTDGELHLYGDGAPDVTIEYLDKTDEEVDA